MSLQFVIDGYNIIHHASFRRQAAKKIKDSREALLDLIKTARLCGSPKNKITVVFDGHHDLTAQVQDIADIRVIFSRDDTADEKIRKMVEASGNPKNMVVVSDDKQIRIFIKSVGARAMNVEEFLGVDKRLRSRREALAEPEITYTQMHKINEELSKLWLK
jgi:predicted RNA-binding protein with PIN domain